MRNLGFKYLVIGLLLMVMGVDNSMAQDGGKNLQRRLEQASHFYLEGIKHQNLGTLRDAARMYEEAIRRVPEHAASYYRLSGIARMINKPIVALEYAQRAYDIDTTCQDYADNYARILTMTGNYAKADSLVSAFIKRDSSNLETTALLAILKFETGQLKQSLALINRVEAKSGIVSTLVDVKRQVLIRMQRYTDAYHYMEEVCDRMPLEVMYRIQLAELAASHGLDSVAVANYSVAIELDSIGLTPQLAMVEYYRIKKLLPEFMSALIPVFAHPDFAVKAKIDYFNTYVRTVPDVYRKYFTSIARLADGMLRSSPNDLDAQKFYAKHLIYSGQFDLAHSYLTRQIEAHNAPVSFYRDVIELAQYRERADTVTKYIDLAKARFLRDPELGMTILYTQFQRGDTTSAIATAEDIIRHSTNDSITSAAYGFCGDMFYFRGASKTAFRYYGAALKLRPDNAMILNNFAYYLSVESRDLEQALEMSSRANELEPQNATYLDTQAWVLYQLGRYEEAQKLMRQALVLDDSKSAEILLHYGDILFAMDKSFMAKTYWQRALEAGADGQQIEERLRQLENQ